MEQGRGSKQKVLVLGAYRQTLTVIRSLGRAGYTVIAGRVGKRSFTDYSRYTSASWQHPSFNDEARFIAELNAYVSRDRIALIFPVGDTAMSCLARHCNQLPTSVALAMPDPDIVLTCQDKPAVNAISDRLGIPQPTFRKVRSYPELLSSFRSIGYPCVVKPENSFALVFGEKAIILQGPEQVPELLPSWPPEHPALLVQKYASGYRHTCHFVADRGQIDDYFEYKILRTDRTDDTGYLVEGVSVPTSPDLLEYCTKLSKELTYSGVGSAQFLVDDDTGQVNFLEINPRLGAACALPFHCGCDLPRQAVEVAEQLAGRRIKPVSSPKAASKTKRAAWLLGDLQAIRRDLIADRLGREGVFQRLKYAASALLRADVHLTWWWRDPLPTGFLCAQFALRLWADVARPAAVSADHPAQDH